VYVFDALGRPVAQAKANDSGSADVIIPSGLAQGLYLVRAGQLVLRFAFE
jgi:hypothetical protein